MNDKPTESNNVFGRGPDFHRLVKSFGDIERSAFTGGYDDYDGPMYWAELPKPVQGKVQRFSPRPGVWMTGVRV